MKGEKKRIWIKSILNCVKSGAALSEKREFEKPHNVSNENFTTNFKYKHSSMPEL